MAELVKIAQARGENRANAIFFHGLGGDARTTWQPTYTKKGEDSHWLEWLAEDIEGVSVYSVSYERALTDWQGSVMELNDRAANVLNLLLLKTDLKAGEIILAAHSLGGLVIKQLLRKAADEAADRVEAWRFIERIRKVAFLSTPHVGADLASWGDWLRILTRPSPPTRSLLHNDSHLRDLNLWYQTWIKQRGIDHLILTETRATSMFGGIIRPDNSDPGLATDPIPIDSDHIGIVKPINRESETYQLVRNFIVRRPEQAVLRQEIKIDAVKDDTDDLHRFDAHACHANEQVNDLFLIISESTPGLVRQCIDRSLIPKADKSERLPCRLGESLAAHAFQPEHGVLPIGPQAGTQLLKRVVAQSALAYRHTSPMSDF